ncbi:cytochrome b561 domain-containing protein [Roseibium album]|uniref:cytochrome b561 domain-containing protein n=1 Tax=Roseibium album TaxID=311410 RepID=UPI003297FC2E
MILEWLISPLDPARPHEVGMALSWHARFMVLGWGVLAPLAVMIARFFKVLPGQNWPRDLDSTLWWRSHWMTQTLVLVLSAVALILVLISPQNSGTAVVHRLFGYAVLVLAAIQGLSGIFRGTKGGPTDPGPDGSLRGDHYDMTPRRLLFERFHKSCGYLALALMVGAIATGLWNANAPNWMWLFLTAWWAVLMSFSVYLQRRGCAVDTYQAIWGPYPEHPGNRKKKQGWGMTRPEFPQRSFDKQRET